jgi:HlyD family secretion protein
MTISDMSVVETELEVDEASIPQVKLGQEVKLRIDAYPNRTFNGVVTEVGSSPILQSSAVDQAVKFKVKAQIKDPPEGIKPGLTAQADILTGFAPQALSVPIQSIVLREKERPAGTQPQVGEAREEEGVYVVEGGKEEGKVAFVPITTGLMGELSIEVKSGLKGDEKLVSGPFKVLRTLKPGDLVVKEKEPPKDAAAGGATQD